MKRKNAKGLQKFSTWPRAVYLGHLQIDVITFGQLTNGVMNKQNCLELPYAVLLTSRVRFNYLNWTVYSGYSGKTPGGAGKENRKKLHFSLDEKIRSVSN